MWSIIHGGADKGRPLLGIRTRTPVLRHPQCKHSWEHQGKLYRSLIRHFVFLKSSIFRCKDLTFLQCVTGSRKSMLDSPLPKCTTMSIWRRACSVVPQKSLRAKTLAILEAILSKAIAVCKSFLSKLALFQATSLSCIGRASSLFLE